MNLNTSYYAVLLSLLAGISTGIGGMIVVFFKKRSTKILSLLLGFSAGIMVYLSFMEIFHESQVYLTSVHGSKNGKILAILSFLFGAVLMAFINEFIPEPHKPHQISSPVPTEKIITSQLFRTGIFTAIAVTIHNFPEGIATYVSGVKSPALGLSIALAIAIHNIPEGIAISVPVYYSTRSKTKAILTSFLSGLSEPLGAIVTMLILGPIITDSVFGIVFGAVAGIMVYIALDELLPSAREYGHEGLSMLGLMLGMALMASGSVIFLDLV